MPTLLATDHILARPILGIVMSAGALGMDTAEICRRAEIDPVALATADATVPVARGIALWRALEAMSGDPHVGVRIAAGIPVGVLGFVYHSVLASDTLGQAWRRAVRYHRLVAGPLRLGVHERNDEACLRFETVPPIADLPFATVQHILLLSLRAARAAVGGEIGLTRVTFVHDGRHIDGALLERAYGAKVVLGATMTELVIERAALARPVPSADPHVARLLDVEASALLEQDRRGDLAGRVRAAARARLSSGEPELGEVARALATTGRTLQRRLASEGTSFAQLVDEVRRDVALHRLADLGTSIADVAFVTGFSELSAFYRAFKRWTGASPVEYRRSAALA